ncbi:4559_t:CDS:10 [Gigaspora margarita]|uniref:4559_t:CDS:1 n=1 Tax=Gigaspora margarita TaxID=4874 RepID=A0ABN7VKL6_GIGMA|nr:4559_t:CDS:10 [Gigaspora margarita]
MQLTKQENLFKKLYKSTIEVSCKPIDRQNENEFPERRNLRELYGTKRFKRKIETLDLSGNALNLLSSETYLICWMAPELIKNNIFQRYYVNQKVYTLNCEMFSIKCIFKLHLLISLPLYNHTFSRKILKGKFANHDDREIQLEFIKIIRDAWCHQPELRIIIPALRQRFEHLANKSGKSILETIIRKIYTRNDYPEIVEEVPEEDVVPVVPLKMSWECFKQNTEFNNPVAKIWVEYYLLYGHHGEKGPIQARKYLKRLLMKIFMQNINVDIAYKCVKDKLRKEIILYFELAANNPGNRNADELTKDELRGLNYLRLAANHNYERAIALLKN